MSNDTAQPLKSEPQRKIAQLCEVCHQIGTSDARWFTQKAEVSHFSLTIYIHHPDLLCLKTSALKGCPMCQFLLRTIENSYDAKNAPTIDGDIVKNSEPSVKTEMTVADRKKLLQEYSEELSPYLTSLLPRNLKNDTQGKEMLDYLSSICGDGRVLLIGVRPKSWLLNNLRAFVLYPFGAADIQDLKTPFIATPYLELATSLGMRNPLPTLVFSLKL